MSCITAAPEQVGIYYEGHFSSLGGYMRMAQAVSSAHSLSPLSTRGDMQCGLFGCFFLFYFLFFMRNIIHWPASVSLAHLHSSCSSLNLHISLYETNLFPVRATF